MVKLNIKERMAGRWFFVVLTTVTSIGPMLLYLAGGILMIKYNSSLTIGDVTVLVALLGRTYMPVNSLLNIQVDWMRSMALFTRIFDYFDMPVEIKNSETPVILEKATGRVDFQHVFFHYDPEREILKDINFTLESGKSIAIVGPSGSGKSTIINLIPRLYDVCEGKVLFDGVDVRDLDLQFLRKNVGVVSQETYLFNGTIRDNLLYAKPDATEEDLIEACKKANIYDFIESQETGLDTMVGNRGLKLSGGEKQRISIARAYIKDAPIMIMDDSVSAVDVKTEETILKNIREKRKGKTTIVIASRVSTVSKLNRILVLNDGAVEAFDTPENLLKVSPTYQRMVYLQELEKEVEGGGN